MNKEEFIEEVKRLGVDVTNEKIEKLKKYYQLLIFWNEKINLTSITLEEDVYLKHFYDSLTLIKAIDLNKKISICDIGSGAGFPGIVLNIFYPFLDVTLVDSLRKRTDFLELIAKELDLKNIKVVNDRAENHIKKNREKYDLLTCRAVSKLNIISEICIPGVKINGYFIPMKANIEEETKSTEYLTILGGRLEKIITFNLPKEKSIRNLIIIKKIKESNYIYPRDYNKIKNNPLS